MKLRGSWVFDNAEADKDSEASEWKADPMYERSSKPWDVEESNNKEKWKKKELRMQEG